MHETLPPQNIPDKGFYYHYKHDTSGPLNNYAYEVMGVGHHTEDDCRPEDTYTAVYRPLYEARVYKEGKLFDVRPLSMFMEEVEKDGVRKPRFSKITDPTILAALEKIKQEMYP
ncbi:MAG: DUF1653 domain-containing protein [Minisyncoccia bacterium]